MIAPSQPDLDRLLADAEADEPRWYALLRDHLEAAYLAADDPYRQSGMRADAARWERGRRPIAAALDHDGALLDVGCANGLLMESLTAWAASSGHRIEPYGLDLSQGLAHLARRRLPAWADRIFVGNAMDWVPPRRFDYVRTELVYVPPARQRDLVARLLRDVLVPGGRLIVCAYGSAHRQRPHAADVAATVRGWGYPVVGTSEGRDLSGVITRVAWVDAPRPA
jgi:SAM-dependent methyltransferase